MRRTLICFAFAFALPACKSNNKDNTKIVVAVWSDLAVPAELQSIRIDAAASETSSKTFALTAGNEPGKSKLPVQLELVPLAAKDATFTVTATGLLGTTEVVSQRAQVSFVSGQALLLKLVLGRACEGVACPANTTCSAGVCNQPLVVGYLPPYDPSKPLLAPDAGVAVDSGNTTDSRLSVDTGSDSGPGAADGLPMPDSGATDVGTISATGGVGGGGGVAGSPGTGGGVAAGGAGGAGGMDGRGEDGTGIDAIDAPLPGVGGAGGGSGGNSGSGGAVSLGGATGSGGAAATGGGIAGVSGSGGTVSLGGATGSGGVTGSGGIAGTGGGGATGGSSGTAGPCVFGSSPFGSCKFGP